MKNELVHISTIQPGDTVEHAGELRTVTATNIKRCSFMGRSIFGDSYNSGNRLVTLVIFPRFYQGKRVN